MPADFDAQWNDDGHHVLHVLLTGETDGYYRDYADSPASSVWRAVSRRALSIRASRRAHRGGKPRGTASGALPPTAFVLFLQNHDQIGNRAFGERLTTLADRSALEAAIALQLLCPQIPLMFMGEEDASKTPFLFFTDHNANSRRCGSRRADGANFRAFRSSPIRKFLPALPIPTRSRHSSNRDRVLTRSSDAARFDLYRRLLDCAGGKSFPG